MRQASSSGLPHVTAIAVSYNRRGQLRHLVDALTAQDYPPDRLTVIIVANGCTDGTATDLPGYQRRGITVLAWDTNVLPGIARNRAMQQAGGELLAFTDDDCVPAPGWVSALVAGFGGDPAVSIVQGRTIAAEPPGAAGTATQQIDALTGIFETCNIAYRRRELVDSGGFNERLGFFGEDTDAGWRLLDTGQLARFAPDAVVRHAVTPVDLRWRVERSRRYRNWPALVRLHPAMRDELLFGRWFLNRRTAAFDLAVLGLLVSRGCRRWSLVLAAPWIVMRAPRRGGRAGILDLAAVAATDPVVAAYLVVGSVRERCLVL